MAREEEVVAKWVPFSKENPSHYRMSISLGNQVSFQFLPCSHYLNSPNVSTIPHPTNCLEEESFQQTQPLPSPFVGSRPLQVLHEKVFFFGDFLTKRYSFDYDIRFPHQKGTPFS